MNHHHSLDRHHGRGKRLLLPLLLLMFSLNPVTANAQTTDINAAIAGSWVFNEKLSDNTDRQVEAALRASGERVSRRWFSTTKDRYRGGPPEHELYDRMSYDDVLAINLDDAVYVFAYEDGFQRPVFTDNRSQTVTLNALEQVTDNSYAHWENGRLMVEARVRDGGFTEESYSVSADGNQLRVQLYIHPKSFRAPIELVRVYDRRQ